MLNKRAFTMVELMVAVVIVATCLVMGLRVFSICASAVSKAYSSTLAVNILQEKMDELQRKAVLENGLKAGSTSQKFSVGGRNLSFMQRIIQWKQEAKEPSEARPKQQEKAIYLSEVELGLSWKAGSKNRELIAKTIIPLSGFRNKF